MTNLLYPNMITKRSHAHNFGKSDIQIIKGTSNKSRKSHHRKLLTHHNNQDGYCAICGEQTWVRIRGEWGQVGNEASLEHIIPTAKGGGGSIDNMCMTCRECNSDRGTINLNLYILAYRLNLIPEMRQLIRIKYKIRNMWKLRTWNLAFVIHSIVN